MSSLLIRAQSWPLITIPVSSLTDNNNVALDPHHQQSVDNNCPENNRMDGGLCREYNCCNGNGGAPNGNFLNHNDHPQQQLAENGKCCCEVPQRHSTKNNFFSRLIPFRRRHHSTGSNGNVGRANGHATKATAAERKRRTGGAAADLNDDDEVAATARGLAETEKKNMVTTSPTFQQLIMTRRLLCRHYYPEGGWGIVIIIVGVLVQILSHGLHLCFGVLLLPTSRRFHTRWYHTSE